MNEIELEAPDAAIGLRFTPGGMTYVDKVDAPRVFTPIPFEAGAPVSVPLECFDWQAICRDYLDRLGHPKRRPGVEYVGGPYATEEEARAALRRIAGADPDGPHVPLPAHREAEDTAILDGMKHKPSFDWDEIGHRIGQDQDDNAGLRPLPALASPPERVPPAFPMLAYQVMTR